MSKPNSESDKAKAGWLKKFFNRTTARSTGYGDMFKTIAALLALSAAITGLAVLTGFVTLSLTTTLTFYAASMLIIAAAATFNYIFAAQFMRANLSAFPVEQGKKYGKKDHVSIDLKRMTKELIASANKSNPAINKIVTLPEDMLIGVYRDEHTIKITSVYGINKKACALFIPTGVLMAHPKTLTEFEIASLIMVEVLKIRNAHARRGILYTIGNIGLSFASLIEDLDHSSWFLGRLIATIGSPFQLVLLFQRSRNRTYHYEAVEQLITECGTDFGYSLKSAYIKLGLPWENPTSKDESIAQTPKPTTTQEKQEELGLFQRMHNFIGESIYTILKGKKEAFSDFPAAGNLQEFLKAKLKENKGKPLNPELESFRMRIPSASPTAAPTPTTTAERPRKLSTSETVIISLMEGGLEEIIRRRPPKPVLSRVPNLTRSSTVNVSIEPIEEQTNAEANPTPVAAALSAPTDAPTSNVASTAANDATEVSRTATASPRS